MKEDDPTVLENESSPVRGASESNGKDPNMLPSEVPSQGGGAWTPLKDEPSRSTPSSPVDSDMDAAALMSSPLQHLMSDETGGRSTTGMNGSSSSHTIKIRKSDDDDPYVNGDPDTQTKLRRNRILIYAFLCVALAAVAAAVIVPVLLLVVDTTDPTASSESSSSTTNDPPVSVVPVAPTTGNTTSYAPSSVPSENYRNSTVLPSNVPTMVNDTNDENATTTTTPTLSPLFVSSPTVSNNNNNNTTAPTTTPVTTTTTTSVPVVASISEENAAKVMPILQTFLIPNDYNALTADNTSVYAQSYQYMISSDSYLAGSTTTTATYSELQVFQRYILIVLNSVLTPAPTATQISLRVNPASDHCSWIGIACNTNATDSISDGVVTDLVWSELQLQGTLPNALQYLSSLTKLDFGTNELSGTIPDVMFANLTGLQHLYLHDNQFQGTLSNTGFGQLSSLKHLFLNDNRFTGTLPQNLGSPGTTVASARPLQWLNLYNNSIVGSIPLNWNLRNVFMLDLGRNQLTGSIPADWVDDMFELRILYLNHNKLSGSFPVNFPLIGNNRLWLLQVNNNQLTGVIPGGYNVRQLDLTEYQNNLFTSMDVDMCLNIVWIGGEMISMRSDCGATCPCEYYCGPKLCYN